MECEACEKLISSSHQTGLCDICRELVELEEKREEVREERVKRDCLRCDRAFWALGKFNRICPGCAEKNRKVADANRYELQLIQYETKYEQTDPVIAVQLKLP